MMLKYGRIGLAESLSGTIGQLGRAAVIDIEGEPGAAEEAAFAGGQEIESAVSDPLASEVGAAAASGETVPPGPSAGPPIEPAPVVAEIAPTPAATTTAPSDREPSTERRPRRRGRRARRVRA
jgi:hypothetical protein